MQKFIKSLTLYIIFSGLVLTFSCNKKEEPEIRTFEDELVELDAMLDKRIEAGYDIKTTMGVYYIVLADGEGPNPDTGDTCYIEYKLHLQNGKLIKRSHDYNTSGIIKFLLGATGIPYMTPGWENGIRKMNKDAEFEFIIPSNLGYGDKGTSEIPPFTTLIYRTKMHDLRPKEK